MIQYKNNLIRKHFKTLMQILLFHIHDILMPEQFTLVKAAGELGARLWVPEINDMDEYLAQVEIAIANLLDAFDTIDPLQILTKIRLHLLVHTMDDVRRFPIVSSSISSILMSRALRWLSSTTTTTGRYFRPLGSRQIESTRFLLFAQFAGEVFPVTAFVVALLGLTVGPSARLGGLGCP